MHPLLGEIVALTNALLELARSPHPDLNEAALLLKARGELIALLPPPEAAERSARQVVLLQLQAADAEVRARLEEHRARIGAELASLSRRGPRYGRGSSRPRLIDHHV